MCQPRPSDQEGKGSEPPGAGLFLALTVPLYLWIIPARSSVSSQERAMPHALRPPCWEGGEDVSHRWAGEMPLEWAAGQGSAPTPTAPAASAPAGGRSI